MTHPIQCACGRLKGTLSQPARVNRVVCYCADCQAFAHFLKEEGEILDPAGGTAVFQTLPGNLVFHEGLENLACMRLSPKGLLRWYARCCNTPIGNTPPNYKVALVGLVHNCLEQPGHSLDEVFGPVQMHVNTQGARGTPKPKASGLAGGLVRVGTALLNARISGSYKDTPFFEAESGKPVVEPKVISKAEHDALRSAVKQAQ